MEVYQSLRTSGRLSGLDKNGILITSFLIIEVIIIVNIICFLINKWSDIDDRMIALKTLVLIVLISLYSIGLIFFRDEFFSAVNLLATLNFKIPYEISEDRQEIISTLEKSLMKINKIWKMMIATYLLPFNILPAIIVFIKFVLFSEDFQTVIKERLSAPFPIWYPTFKHSNLECLKGSNLEPFLNAIIYFTSYTIHSSYLFLSSLLSHMCYVTTTAGMTTLQYELKLLRLSLVEMDKLIGESNFTNGYDKRVKDFMKYFIVHHQTSCRMFYIINEGVRFIAAAINFTISLYMCLSIYVVIRETRLVIQIEEGICLVIWASAMYLFDVIGERIKTEDENLRNAIYECQWLDKPKWFKTSLLIAMTRSSRPIEIKPFGLFALSLNSFAKTINAAYSYYNVLHNFNSV